MSQQIAALVVVAVFYAAYFIKMLLQRRRGICTQQIGKGEKSQAVLRVERLMGLATVLIVPVELGSIFLKTQPFGSAVAWIGVGIAAFGVWIFVLAMGTMRDSWRAGIPADDRTALVTTGIYRFSRNPAFLGFDCLYLGLLLAYANLLHLLAAAWAMGMLHMQILQEERFLMTVFGEDYQRYQRRTGRYVTLCLTWFRK